jgi:hypothetical protein
VGVVDGAGDRLEVGGGTAAGQRPRAYHIGEARPGDVAHRVIMVTFALAHLVDAHEVFVLQTGGRLGFGAKAADALLPARRRQVLQAIRADHLDGDKPIGAALPGAIDHAHAA